MVLHLHGGCYTMGSAEGRDRSRLRAWRRPSAAGRSSPTTGWRPSTRIPRPSTTSWRSTAGSPASTARSHRRERRVRRRRPGDRLAVRLRDAGATRSRPRSTPSRRSATSPSRARRERDLGSGSVAGPRPPPPLVASYIHTADPAAPLISPVIADLRGLPPLLIQAAEGEALRDDAGDSRRPPQPPACRPRSSSSPDTVHSFVLFDFLPESRLRARAVRRARGAGLVRHVASGLTPCAARARNWNQRRPSARCWWRAPGRPD